MSAYTIINLQSDAASLSKSIKDAVSESNAVKVQQAWIDVAINSAKITSGMAELAANDPKWARLLGGAATIESVRQSALRIEADLQSTNGFDNVKVGDVLSVVGGLPLRLVLERRQQDLAARAELALGEAAKFFPTDAALASWMAQAEQGQAQVVYEHSPQILSLNVISV